MPNNRIFNRMPNTPQGASISTCGFVACPAILQQSVGADQREWQIQLYQRAMEEAAAVVRPPITQRWQADLLN